MKYLKIIALCCISISLWQGVVLAIASSPTPTIEPTATVSMTPMATVTFMPTVKSVQTDIPTIQATPIPSLTSTVTPTDLPTIQVTSTLPLTSTLVPITSTPTISMAITETGATAVVITSTVINVSATSSSVIPSITPMKTITPTIISAVTSTPMVSITPIVSDMITPTLDIITNVTGTSLTATPIMISPTQTEMSPTMSASPILETAIMIGKIENDLEESLDIYIDILQDDLYLQTIKSDALGNFAVTLPQGIYEFDIVSDRFLNTSEKIEIAQDTQLTCYLVYGDLNQDGIIDLLDVGILRSLNQVNSNQRLQKLFLIAQAWQGQKVSSCS